MTFKFDYYLPFSRARFATRRLFLLLKFAMFGIGLSLASTIVATELSDEDEAHEEHDRPGIEEILVHGARADQPATAHLPMDIMELPQSVSQISREFMDLTGITDINDAMMNVTGVNVTLYDTQRPLYFSRGFQITDFQVDGIPTYSGSTNQEYDTALYQRIEVIRGTNGLLSGTGEPSATVNLVRKRPSREFDAAFTVDTGSWHKRRGVGDVSVPFTEGGGIRSRVVVAYQDSDSFRDRYQEDKLAMLGVIEADIFDETTVSLGFQNQDNNPEGTIWGTIPIYAADGSVAEMPVATSFAPEWTQWQRESTTVFADVKHSFTDHWRLTAAINRTEGEVFSLRVYALGFPDRESGEGMNLLAGVGAAEDTRDSLDVYLSGQYQAFGQSHDIVMGGTASELESVNPGYSSVADWSYAVPDAWDYNGQAPMPEYSVTGETTTSTTKQSGLYVANRLRVSDGLSLVAGARVSSWDGGEAESKVSGEFTPYVGAVYDLTKCFSLYASYTDIFSPVTNKNKNNRLLEPTLGTNVEAGLKGHFYDGQLTAAFAVFNTKQDNYPVRDLTQPDGSLPDGSSAFIGVDGTESQGFEMSVSGHLRERWLVNAGYTYVDTKRHENDRIWTNLPEHSIQLATHYRLSGVLDKLTLGGGLNWQSETVGYGVSHPFEEAGVTFEQDPYTLVNLYATWRFSDAWNATVAGTNIFDKTYWANIDYANYGEPRNLSLSLRWQY